MRPRPALSFERNRPCHRSRRRNGQHDMPNMIPRDHSVELTSWSWLNTLQARLRCALGVVYRCSACPSSRSLTTGTISFCTLVQTRVTVPSATPRWQQRNALRSSQHVTITLVHAFYKCPRSSAAIVAAGAASALQKLVTGGNHCCARRTLVRSRWISRASQWQPWENALRSISVISEAQETAVGASIAHSSTSRFHFVRTLFAPESTTGTHSSTAG